MMRKIQNRNVICLQDYYPFGMIQPGRSVIAGEYRYGYQGYEDDGEISGTGNSYTTFYRQYDPRLGRWWSIDPAQYFGSPYVSMANNPILFADNLGDSINLGNLYEQDESGEYKHQRQIKGFELFANTPEGENWIRERAHEGFKLEGVFIDDLSITAHEEGGLSKQGIDATFNVIDVSQHPDVKGSSWATGGGDGLTESSIKGGRLKNTFNIDRRDPLSLSNRSLLESTNTWTHEAMFHGDYKEGLFLRNQPLNNLDGRHTNTQLRNSSFYDEGSRVMQRANHQLGSPFSWDYVYYNIMMPGFGHPPRRDITE